MFCSKYTPMVNRDLEIWLCLGLLEQQWNLAMNDDCLIMKNVYIAVTSIQKRKVKSDASCTESVSSFQPCCLLQAKMVVPIYYSRIFPISFKITQPSSRSTHYWRTYILYRFDKHEIIAIERKTNDNSSLNQSDWKEFVNSKVSTI